MNPHFHKLLEAYIHWLKTLGYSSASQNIYQTNLKLFFTWLVQNNIHQVMDLEDKHLAIYFDYLQTRQSFRKQGALGKSHLNKLFDAVDKFLTFLHQQGFKRVLVPTHFRLRQDKEDAVYPIHPFTQQEIKELIHYIPISCENIAYKGNPYLQRERREQQLYLAFTLFYACGLRRKEGFNLEINQVNLDNKTLLI